MTTNNEFWSEFLEMYKSLPVLWNVKSENYCNRVEKEAAYDKLVDKLREVDPDANRVKVRRKIHIYRSNYRRELRKKKKIELSNAGTDVRFQSNLWYFDLLQFLTDQEAQSKAKSNMSDDDNVSDRSIEVFEPPVKRKRVKDDEILKMACEKLKGSNDAVLEKVWTSQYSDKVFWSEFLDMYKSLPVLWNVKCENYCNRVEKEAAYDKLVDKLKEIDPEANRRKVSKKIHIFRTNYRRELKKMKKTETSGVGFQSNLWYFDLLHFLTDPEEHSKVKNSMSDDEYMSDRSIEVFEPPVKRKNVNDDEILKVRCERVKENNNATSIPAKSCRSQYAYKLFWSEFLEMYESLPVLWNVKSENFCNPMEKEAAYAKLVDKLKQLDPKANRGKVIRKIHILRSNYKRELRKMKKTEISGVGFQSNLWYFDLLHFLTDPEVHSEVKSIMSDNECVSDEVIEEEEIPKKTCDGIKESNDATSVLAEGWALQYAELGNDQRVLARTIWADVLFHGCMNRLTQNMVEDIHQVLKGTSNTSTPTPTSPRSSMPFYEEYSYSPQPQFTFVAYQHSDETLISTPTKTEQCDVLQNTSTSTTTSKHSRSIMTNNEAIQRSSVTPTNLKEYIDSFTNDNENQNDLNNSDEIDENIEEEEYEDILYEVDDDDMMESIDREDDSHDEMNNKNLCQDPEENLTSNAAKVAVSILDHIREEKLMSDTTRKNINWTKLNDDETRELKRLQRKRYRCVCDQCGRHFADSSNLKLHLMRHSGIKNYECKVCNAKFYTAHLLKRHSLMHTSTPPTFACKYCGKTFIYNNYRLRCERDHFREPRFNCDYCDRMFYKASAKRNHELKHTDCREFHCEVCDQHFLRKTDLNAHFRSKTHKSMEQKRK